MVIKWHKKQSNDWWRLQFRFSEQIGILCKKCYIERAVQSFDWLEQLISVGHFKWFYFNVVSLVDNMQVEEYSHALINQLTTNKKIKFNLIIGTKSTLGEVKDKAWTLSTKMKCKPGHAKGHAHAQ